MITIETEFTNPSLPSSLPFAAQIKALPFLRTWWQTDADFVTLDTGAITNLAAKAGAAPANLVPPASGSRPLFEANGIGSIYPVAAFDGTDDQMVASSIPYTQTGNFSWIFIGKLSAMGADQHIASLWSSGANGSRLRATSAAAATFAHGSGFASMSGIVWDQPNLIIGSSKQTSVRVYCNGQVSSAVASDNVNSAGGLRLGAANTGGLQPATMDMAEFLIFQTDVLDQADWMSLFESYASTVYGVTIN